jgi:hypothetical protein
MDCLTIWPFPAISGPEMTHPQPNLIISGGIITG